MPARRARPATRPVGTASSGPPRASERRDGARSWSRRRRHADELGIDPQRIVLHGFSAGARIGAQLLVGPDDPALAGPTRWPSPTDRIAGLIGFYGYYSGFQFQPDRYYGGRAGSKDPD